MLSEAAMDNLRRFAQVGSLGAGVIELHADTLQPEAGSEVALSWNFDEQGADLGTLQVSGCCRLLVPPVGQHRLRVAAEAITANLWVGGESVKVRIVPRLLVPTGSRKGNEST